MSEAVFTANH